MFFPPATVVDSAPALFKPLHLLLYRRNRRVYRRDRPLPIAQTTVGVETGNDVDGHGYDNVRQGMWGVNV